MQFAKIRHWLPFTQPTTARTRYDTTIPKGQQLQLEGTRTRPRLPLFGRRNSMQRMKKRRAVAQFLFTLLVTPFFLLLLLFQSQFNYVSCHYILLLRNPCFLSQQGDHHFEIINSEIIFSFHQQQPSLLLFFVVLMLQLVPKLSAHVRWVGLV